MSQTTINNNDGGLAVRTALNAMFTELYSRWKMLAQSSVALTVPADTTDDILVTIPVPGGTLGPNGRVRVWTMWSSTNSANSKTARIKLNGTSFGSPAWTASAAFMDQREIANRNSQSSQAGTSAGTSGGLGGTASPIVTVSVDTSVDTTLTISGQKAISGESMVLESYRVETFYAP